MGLQKNLKAIRKEKKFSQRQLAEKSGVSYSMVCKLESGEQKNPSLETIEKIADALDITPAELMTGLDIFEQFDIVMGNTLKELEKEINSPKEYVYTRLREFLTSKQATDFFSINHNAISPDDFDIIENAIVDYIQYQFSKFNDKDCIYTNPK
ncbi:MAG: helix-turn-helix domain-containing protein [Ruminococcus flavefaciens]|nr:helix-turn-helix domain-containing protein [Ruminococcus flavefaciens]